MCIRDRALGFLYSCYGGVSTDLPSAYLGEINSTTDEYVLPYSWNTDGYWGAYAFNTASSTNQDWLWGTTYQYIGPVSYTHLDVYKRQVYALICSQK